MALIGIGVMTRPPILTGKDDFDHDTLMPVFVAVLAMAMIAVVIAVFRWLLKVHHSIQNVSLYLYASLQSLILALIFGTLDEFRTNDTTWEDMGVLAAIGLLWAVGNLFLVLALQIEEAGIVGSTCGVRVHGNGFISSLLGALSVVSGVIAVIARKLIQSLSDTSSRKKAFKFLLR
ncbi:uncharacterized protein LOC110855194 [Folsomia candida]|uniref:Uncharacterized protein n=1 Tax=Folsomia candida TaxID=158441 RepID=A0A226DT69_FOLCA|nr:uncharacterized protein LOC110855194 [Folsomia candida]OXA48024.1 hypothetical protein Fcan01_17183 [Folsomia candida]